MKLTPWVCLLSLAAVAAALAPSAPATAAVRIELKNGMAVTADECRESDGTLHCYKMGGTFDIEKRDVVSIKKTTESENPEEDESAPAPEADVKEGAGETTKSTEPKNPEADAGKRLDRIAERKRALLPEGEKLLKEREDLLKQVDSSPDWMTVDRFEELKKKIASLDERIKGFNNEVKQLDQEEQTIRNSMKKEPPQSPEVPLKP